MSEDIDRAIDALIAAHDRRDNRFAFGHSVEEQRDSDKAARTAAFDTLRIALKIADRIAFALERIDSRQATAARRGGRDKP